MAGFEEEMRNNLAASLAIMTRRPGVLVTLPTVDGAYPEQPHAGHVQEVNVVQPPTTAEAMDIAVDVPPFTPEMAQAFLDAPPIPEPEPQIPDAMLKDAQETPTPVYPVQETPTLPVPEPVFAFESPIPQGSSVDTQQPDQREVAEEVPVIDSLAGFDPSKYLGLGAGVPQTTMSPPPTPAPEEHPEEPQREVAPIPTAKSLYGDIQPGASIGGAKNSREAMQMLRELSVLRSH